MSSSHTTSVYSYERILSQDAARLGHKVPHILVLGELDVTEVRSAIRSYRRRTKKKLSLTTLLLYSYVQALEEYKYAQGCKSWRNKVVVFDDVDVLFPVELKNKSLDPKILRAANRKSIQELEEEINVAKQKEQVDIPVAQKIFLRFPRMVRDFLYRIMIRTPQVRKDTFGTALFSSPGLSVDFKQGKINGVSLPVQSMGICIGSKFPKIVEEGKRMVERDFVSFAVQGDHAIIDGVQLGKFISRFMEHTKITAESLNDD